MNGIVDGLSVVEDLCGVQMCMPPKVAVPKPGPCKGSKRGPARSVVSKVVGNKPPTARPLGVAAARKRLEGIYGERLHITGSGKEINQHIKELANVPAGMHDTVNRYFNNVHPNTGGIYIGVGPVTEISPGGKELQGVQPRGWTKGKTFAQVAGVFIGKYGEVVIGSGLPSGSTSGSAHELAHALDVASRTGAVPISVSKRQPWRDVMNTVYASPDLLLKPYYTPTVNPTGWLSEAFAESLAAWAKVHRRGADEQVQAILGALGANKPGRQPSPAVTDAVKDMIAMFEYMAGSDGYERGAALLH